MAYHYRAAGRAQGSMLAYAKRCLKPEVYERVHKANRRVTIGVYVYIIIFFSLMFIPLGFLGKISTEVYMGFTICALLSPIVYFPLYYMTFGKEWNQYVKWYTKTDRRVPFIYEDMISKETEPENMPKAPRTDSEMEIVQKAGIQNAGISDIRGGMYDIKIIYDNGYVMKASGELAQGAKFYTYVKSMTKWQPPHDTEELTMIDAEKMIIDVLDRQGPERVWIVFEGKFAMAEKSIASKRNFYIKFNSRIENVEDVWLVRNYDVDEEANTVKLTYYKGLLPGWNVEEKTVSSTAVSMDQIEEFKVVFSYELHSADGSNEKTFQKEVMLTKEAFLKMIGQ